MLPEEGYVKATQLCVKLANAIKQATIKAEEDIGIRANAPEKEVSPDPQPIEKRGIKLKSNL